MYRVGLPFWKFVARSGRPVRFRVNVRYDPEVNRYWAMSPDLDGLVVEGGTIDEVREEVRASAEALLEMAVNGHHGRATPELRFRDTAICAA